MSTHSDKKDLSDETGPIAAHGEGAVQHVQLGYETRLKKNHSVWTTLGMTLAISAVPYGIGGLLSSAI